MHIAIVIYVRNGCQNILYVVTYELYFLLFMIDAFVEVLRIVLQILSNFQLSDSLKKLNLLRGTYYIHISTNSGGLLTPNGNH